MRNEEKKKKLKKFLVISCLTLLIAMLAFGGFYTLTESKLSKYEVEASELTCTNKMQINKFLEGLKLNYFVFSNLDLEGKLKQKYLCIGKIDARISFPDKLTLKVIGRKAEFAASQIIIGQESNPEVNLPIDYQVATESSKAAETVKIIDQILKEVSESSNSSYFLIDSEGVIFDESYGSISFPVLKIVGEDLKVGGRVPGDLVGKVKELTRGLSNMEAPTDNIIIVGDKIIIDSKPRLIFSLNKRLDYQTTSLQLILAQAKMNSDSNLPRSDNIESIDLRFNKPVVVYSKKKK